MTYRILVTDDEKHSRVGVSTTLKQEYKESIHIDTANHGADAFDLIGKHSYDLLITDIRMPKMNGLELLEALRNNNNGISTILLTGFAEFEYAQQGIKFGAVDYLLKPVHQEQLLAAVERVLQSITPVSQAHKSSNSYIQEAIAYMEQHISEAFTIKEVSSHVHLNASYFSVLFKEETGVSFTDFLSSLRLDKAKMLLRDSELSLDDICEQIGIQSTSYFIKMFKKFEGVTPKQFRSKE